MARQSGLKSQNWGLKYFYGSNFLLSACPPRHYQFFKVYVLIILIEHFLWGLESDVMYVDRRYVLYVYSTKVCGQDQCVYNVYKTNFLCYNEDYV